MSIFNKSIMNDAPWKILFSSILLSVIGLIALNSISYQNASIMHSPFYRQLFFLFLSFISFSFSFITPKYMIHKYAYIIYGMGVILVILPFFGSPHAGTYRWLDIGLPIKFKGGSGSPVRAVAIINE